MLGFGPASHIQYVFFYPCVCLDPPFLSQHRFDYDYNPFSCVAGVPVGYSPVSSGSPTLHWQGLASSVTPQEG